MIIHIMKQRRDLHIRNIRALCLRDPGGQAEYPKGMIQVMAATIPREDPAGIFNGFVDDIQGLIPLSTV